MSPWDENAPKPRPKAELVAVRRADLRDAATVGGVFPARHGAPDDPRYPSPRDLRRGIGIAVDVLLHLAVAVAVGYALNEQRAPIGWVVGGTVLGYVAISVLHRVFLQAACATTVGKAVVGLRLIRDDDGGRPTLWLLAKMWLLGVGLVLANVLSS